MKTKSIIQSIFIFIQLLILTIISIFSVYKFITDSHFRTVSHFLVTLLTIGCTCFLTYTYFTKVVKIKTTKK